VSRVDRRITGPKGLAIETETFFKEFEPSGGGRCGLHTAPFLHRCDALGNKDRRESVLKNEGVAENWLIDSVEVLFILKGTGVWMKAR